MKRPLARDGRPYDNRGVPNAVAVYLGVYKTLYPTPPGFLSAGTLSSPTPVFHPQARCLPTTSNLHYSHETYLLRHVCQNRHLLLCPCYLRRCRPHPHAADGFSACRSGAAEAIREVRQAGFIRNAQNRTHISRFS